MAPSSLRPLRLTALLVVVLTAGAAVDEAADPQPPRVGDPAPPLRIMELVQGPDDADLSWEALRGQVAIVEFWATWCLPCIAAIPHLNELAETFADEPVRIIAISDEEARPVREFLSKRTMSAWVAVDEENITFETYHITGIPHTVIVDREGRIAAITYPTRVTEEVVRNVLEGRGAGLAERQTQREVRDNATALLPGVDPTATIDERATFFQLIIRPDDEKRGMYNWGMPGRLTARGVTLDTLIEIAYEASRARIDGVDLLDDGTYTVVVRVPDAVQEESRNDLLRSLLRQALESTFEFTAERVEREVDALALRVIDGVPHNLTPSERTFNSLGTGGGFIRIYSASTSRLARGLENLLRLPVVDETGLEGSFDGELAYDPHLSSKPRSDQIDELANALREQLGLQLVPARVVIEVLAVRPRESSNASE